LNKVVPVRTGIDNSLCRYTVTSLGHRPELTAALPLKADIREVVEFCPLLTQPGHFPDQKAPDFLSIVQPGQRASKNVAAHGQPLRYCFMSG
jgi:hypothetical protein